MGESCTSLGDAKQQTAHAPLQTPLHSIGEPGKQRRHRVVGRIRGVGAINHAGQPNRRRVPVALDIDEWDRLPDQIFAASRSPYLGDAQLFFELRETRSGQLALMAYSSKEALIQACGTGQSWTKIHSVDIPWLAKTVGFDVVLFDLALPAELRNPELDARDFPNLEPIPVDPNMGDRIYLPSRPFDNRHERVHLELQPGPDGKPALLVYFSVEQLRAGCGPHQAWVAFPSNAIRRIAREAGASTVLFNPILSDEIRHHAPVKTR